MKLHSCKLDYPEKPERISSIISHLQHSGLLNQCIYVDKLEEASNEYIELLHPQAYIDYVAALSRDYKESEDSGLRDTYYNKFTNMAARKALTGAKLITDKIMGGEWNSGYAVIRPPGHHPAVNDAIGGFCIFNTAALTAKYAQKKYNLKRILIFDWDVHHGNSTQKIFYDEEILFISIHRFDEGYFYPGPSGAISNLGRGTGLGYNLNLPWNTDYFSVIGDPEYIYIFRKDCLSNREEF